MTVNEWIGKIEMKVREWGKMSMDQLRLEFGEENAHQAKQEHGGKSRVELIAELIVDYFSVDFDSEINTDVPPD